MKSVMKHDFSRIPRTDIPHSTFDRSHGLKTAFDSGYLVPIECQEVLPGDTVSMKGNFLARLPACVTPIMDNVFLETQWFFVPSRILWNNFVKMMGERVNPADSIDYLVPQIEAPSEGFAVGSLADFFGIPTGVSGLKVNALPFRAYAKIWDDWYRDENLQDSIIQSSDDLGDSNGTIPWNTLLKRGKRHDYFTSSLPWPQKGDGVELPLSGNGQLMAFPFNFGEEASYAAIRNTSSPSNSPAGAGWSTTLSGSTPVVLNGKSADGAAMSGVSAYDGIVVPTSGSDGPYHSIHQLNNGQIASLGVDLSSATAATINSLRMAFQLQRMLETDARGGTRFVELIRNHFKTICPDARLQRPEYLGGSSQQIDFTPIAQTSATVSSSTPQGNLVAQAKCFSTVNFTKSFTEHGYLIGLANVRCDLNYQQGLNRMWSRRGRYDFFWPTLQNLGEQAVLNKEIYAQGPSVKDSLGNVIDDQAFGYQERYAEYRYAPSIITGKMRSTASGSLDVWHLAQKFDALPTLSKEFIEDSPPLKRALAVQDEPEIILDAYLKQLWTRPMSTYSIPGLIDHL